MTRLPLLGLSTFADDFGVLPLRPHVLRLQVFLGDDQVRAMIEKLVARGLVRRYAVEDVEYVSIVDGEIHQRVGKCARRRYPALPSLRDGQGPRTTQEETAPTVGEAEAGLTTPIAMLDHRKPVKSPTRCPRPSPTIRRPGPTSRAIQRPTTSGTTPSQGRCGAPGAPMCPPIWRFMPLGGAERAVTSRAMCCRRSPGSSALPSIRTGRCAWSWWITP